MLLSARDGSHWCARCREQCASLKENPCPTYSVHFDFWLSWSDRLAPATSSAGMSSAQTPARKKTLAKVTTTAKPAAKVTASRTSLARAATAARARRAAATRRAQRALTEAQTPRYKVDAIGNLVPDIRAAAAIIYNPATGDVLWEANSHDQRSIASLTKIMTAVTFIADDPDLTQRVTVTRADMRNASTTHIRAGDVLSYSDLLHLTLIASDNAAARVLAVCCRGGPPRSSTG